MHSPRFKIETPRQVRVLEALIQNRLVWREGIDRIARASNGPHVIMELRKLGWRIPCKRVEKTDCDGKRCRPGFYWLHPNHRNKAIDALRQAVTCPSAQRNALAKSNSSNG